mmetsp:Transcript_33966/g.88140  ORF Transcript_33966/g.88140 Transcript_33966/m.88140 type:complete len:378 (+) Transcript_33966:1357-2490(+)
MAEEEREELVGRVPGEQHRRHAQLGARCPWVWAARPGGAARRCCLRGQLEDGEEAGLIQRLVVIRHGGVEHGLHVSPDSSDVRGRAVLHLVHHPQHQIARLCLPLPGALPAGSRQRAVLRRSRVTAKKLTERVLELVLRFLILSHPQECKAPGFPVRGHREAQPLGGVHRETVPLRSHQPAQQRLRPRRAAQLLQHAARALAQQRLQQLHLPLYLLHLPDQPVGGALFRRCRLQLFLCCCQDSSRHVRRLQSHRDSPQLAAYERGAPLAGIWSRAVLTEQAHQQAFRNGGAHSCRRRRAGGKIDHRGEQRRAGRGAEDVAGAQLVVVLAVAGQHVDGVAPADDVPATQCAAGIAGAAAPGSSGGGLHAEVRNLDGHC